MRDPIDIVDGTVVDVDENGMVTIKAYYPDWYTMVKRGYNKCKIQLLDNRKLSMKQRNACYALLRTISEATGQGLTQTKRQMKLDFITDEYSNSGMENALEFLSEDLQRTGEKIFSLSNGPMSLVCAFQKYLVRFIIEWDIPCTFPLIKYVDDVQDYEYACLVQKKCAVCGMQSDLHHVDHVGAGRDREEIIHEGMSVLPLCRKHHTEAHTMGEKAFRELYHLDGGITLDKDLCKLYGLKKRKEVI